ncbi:hypothetical protein HZS_5783 [Henneguya salminicola]|nr:hypothetical protein HZS_5783 [Henneguya salminicola]
MKQYLIHLWIPPNSSYEKVYDLLINPSIQIEKLLSSNRSISQLISSSFTMIIVDFSIFLTKSIIAEPMTGTISDRIANGLARLGYTISANFIIYQIMCLISSWAIPILKEYIIFVSILVTVDFIIALTFTLPMLSVYLRIKQVLFLQVIKYNFLENLPLFQRLLIYFKIEDIPINLKIGVAIYGVCCRGKTLTVFIAIYGICTQPLMEYFDFEYHKYNNQYHNPKFLNEISQAFFWLMNSHQSQNSILFLPLENVYIGENSVNSAPNSKFHIIKNVLYSFFININEYLRRFWHLNCLFILIISFKLRETIKFFRSVANHSCLYGNFCRSCLNDCKISSGDSPYTEFILNPERIHMMSYIMNEKYIISQSIFCGIYVWLIDDILSNSNITPKGAIQIFQKRQMIYFGNYLPLNKFPHPQFCLPTIWSICAYQDILFIGCSNGSIEMYDLSKKLLIYAQIFSAHGVIFSKFRTNEIICMFTEDGIFHSLKLSQNAGWDCIVQSRMYVKIMDCFLAQFEISKNCSVIGGFCLCHNNLIIFDPEHMEKTMRINSEIKILWLLIDSFSDNIFITGNANGYLDVYDFNLSMRIYHKQLSYKSLQTSHISSIYLFLADTKAVFLLDRATFIHLHTFLISDVINMVFLNYNILSILTKDHEIYFIQIKKRKILGRFESFSNHKPDWNTYSEFVLPPNSQPEIFLIWSSWTCSFFVSKHKENLLTE